MNGMTKDQLRFATASGAVSKASIQSTGEEFEIIVQTTNGSTAPVVSARHKTPRTFANPANALSFLHSVGITAGEFVNAQGGGRKKLEKQLWYCMDSSSNPLIHLAPEIIARADPALLQIITLQQARIELLEARIEELLAQLGKNSSNSDKPPSSDSPFREKKAQSAPKAPRKYHKGARQAFMEPTQTYQLIPECCSCGCRQLSEPQCYHVHQYIELPPISPEVEHFKLFRARCTSCGRTVKAVVPPEKRVGFGPSLCATIVELLGVHGDSRRLV